MAGADVPGINQMLAWGQVLGPKRRMDGIGPHGLVHGGRCGVDVNHQAWGVIIAGLGEVHDPNAIDAIGFTMSVAFVWPAIAKPRRRRSRPS